MTLVGTPPPTPVQTRPSIDLELADPAFSGPLALLLQLIESRRLPVAKVSIAEVADQFLERMKTLVGMDPEVLADFLVVAAKLLVIKSRALLPSQTIEPEEIDVAAELEQRLLEYRIFREAAEMLRQREESDLHSYPRQPSQVPVDRPDPPLEPPEPEALRDAMVRMLKALRPGAQELALAPRVTVHDRIEYLVARLSDIGSAVFSELAGGTLQEIVATFLALLELLRQRILLADQETPFAEIRLSLAAPMASES